VNDDRIRAVIVGAGLMGRWHAHAIRRAGGEIIAIVDDEPARAQALARAHSAVCADSLAAAVSGARVHVAHICTPLNTHLDLARKAIALGLHVVVEKPLVHTAAETKMLLGEAAGRGVLLTPVYQFGFQRGVRDILAARSRLGRVLHLQAVACSAGADGSSTPLQRDRVAAEILPHALSLFAAILERPIAGADWSVHQSGPGEIVATAALGSVTTSVLISMAGRPTRNSLHVIAEHGSAHADLFHGFSVIESGTVSRARKILHPFDLSARTFLLAGANLLYRSVRAEPAYPGLRELVLAFYSAIRGRGAIPIPPEAVLDVASARDKIIAAMSAADLMEVSA
jgi:predicted dehydrogenase